jgi:hypothetical protein
MPGKERNIITISLYLLARGCGHIFSSPSPDTTHFHSGKPRRYLDSIDGYSDPMAVHRKQTPTSTSYLLILILWLYPHTHPQILIMPKVLVIPEVF